MTRSRALAHSDARHNTKEALREHSKPVLGTCRVERELAIAMSSDDSDKRIESAIAFLVHPQSQSAPMNQKVLFLKHKGLSQAEIDEAVKRSGVSTAPAQ